MSTCRFLLGSTPADPSIRRVLSLLPIALVALAGCQRREYVQSVLHPTGAPAAEIARLWWFMFAVTGAVFVLVVILMLVAVTRRPRDEQSAPPFGSTGFIVLGGLAMPTVILVALLVMSLRTLRAVRLPDTELTVQVIGHQWWWEVRYPEHQIITANEIHIPVGEPVRLELWSADVIHSFWVPRLHGKMDTLPGHTNWFWIQADRQGVYRGQCAEYCGVQHAWMGLEVVARPPEEFQQWITRQQDPHEDPPVDPILRRGRQVFFEAMCHNCHAVRGTPAIGRIGPDLTHIGSRRTIGAGMIPNTPGNLAGWITNPQAIKPGNRMPRIYLSPEDLHSLRAYMQSLD